MEMQKYEELERMLCKELEEIVNRGEITGNTLDYVDKIVHSIKNVKKIGMMSDGGYSGNGERRLSGYYDGHDGMYANGRGGSAGGSSYNGGGSSYDSGSSYRRGRDSMGRYSSHGSDTMIQNLEYLEQNLSGRDREMVQRMLEDMRNR